MNFWITVTYDRKNYNFIVEQIEKTNAIEKYKVSGGNGSIVLQNNRPVFVARNLKHRSPNWKITEGQLKYRSFAELIIKAIANHLKNNPDI